MLLVSGKSGHWMLFPLLWDCFVLLFSQLSLLATHFLPMLVFYYSLVLTIVSMVVGSYISFMPLWVAKQNTNRVLVNILKKKIKTILNPTNVVISTVYILVKFFSYVYICICNCPNSLWNYTIHNILQSRAYDSITHGLLFVLIKQISRCDMASGHILV